MPRSIKQCNFSFFKGKFRLLGYDGYAALSLLGFGIQETVTRIYSPRFAQHAALKKKGLGKRSLSRINMSKNAQVNMFFYHLIIIHYLNTLKSGNAYVYSSIRLPAIASRLISGLL